jgi:arylformamidase
MSQWVDLTQPITGRDATHPPGHSLPEFEDVATYEVDGVNITRLHLETHCGTHLDAPTHFYPSDEYETIDDVTPAEMITEGVVVDCRDVGHGEAISRDRIAAAMESVALEPGEFVIVDTGMDPTETEPEVYLHEYAYPSVEAAEFLLDRDVSVIATDALGVDAPGAAVDEHEVHRLLLGDGVRIVEGVSNLGALDAGRYDVVRTPLPYRGRDGSHSVYCNWSPVDRRTVLATHR